MKRTIFLSLYIIMGIICTFAYDFEVDNLWFNLPQTGPSLTLVGGRNRSGDLIIPQSVSYRNREFEIGYLKNYAFQGCSFNKVQIPPTIRNISKGSFLNAGVNQLILSEGIENIGISAFEDSHIEGLVIPNSVTRIEDVAFRDSKKLRTITFGSGLRYIHWGAFQRCEAIENVVCLAETPPEIYVSEIENYNNPVFANAVYQFAILKVPAKSIGKYKASSLWSKFHTIEPISNEQLTQFEQLFIEWDMLGKKHKQIDTDGYRLSGGYNGTFYAYNIIQTIDKKGKVKVKRGDIIDPLGVWSDGSYDNRKIAVGTIEDEDIIKRLMLHGYIKLSDGSDYEEFYTIPIEFPFNEPIIFEGITSSGKNFTMQIAKEYGGRREISPINDAGGRTPLISVLSETADVVVTYKDNGEQEHKFLMALSYLPNCYRPK